MARPAEPRGLDELRQELKNPQLDLAAFKDLSEAQAGQLLQGYRDARARQHQALRRALEDSLGFIPAVLRIPIKKIFFRK